MQTKYTPVHEINQVTAKLFLAAPELLEALQETVADLFYQIEAKHGPKKASEYPSIVKAKAAIKKAAAL